MNIDDFRQMYVTELQELRSVEAQLVDALPKMADVANHSELKQAIQSHLEETRSQRDRLDEILRGTGPNPASTSINPCRRSCVKRRSGPRSSRIPICAMPG